MAPPSGGIWAPITMRVLRHAFKKTSQVIRSRVVDVSRPLNSELQPIFARTTPTHAIPRVALIRQGKGRWSTTQSAFNAVLRRFISSGKSVKYNPAAFPKSATATAVSRLTIRAPFASTLRPNLTGGAIPRTSGGYSLGGGRINGTRYFSHTPAAPAQVVHNASIAVRAFWLSGQKARFDGTTAGGEKRYRTVSSLQDETIRKINSIPRNAPGSYIEFQLNPTITALSPLGATLLSNDLLARETQVTLNTPGFRDVLKVDFARAVKDLTAIWNDIDRLATLGDLQPTVGTNSVIRIRFPGCDAGTVECLCDEVGVQRGIIREDPSFSNSVGGPVALMFPFAPTREHTISSPGGSLRSEFGHEYENVEEASELEEAMLDHPWQSGVGSTEESSETESLYFANPSEQPSSSEYEGMEGIIRFIQQCDNARRAP